ncbi:MAG: hypothetical protein JXA81_14930 [Sedimentisphaerales bacterium]|nr:hypothetical protein [Sedimentisphaerales bacterium]
MNNDYKKFNTVLDQARHSISVEFKKRKRKKVLANKINCILRKMRIEGMQNSGPERRAVRDACDEEIYERAKIAWTSIQKAHKAFGSHITDTLEKDLKQEVNLYIEKIVEYVSGVMAKRLRLKEQNENHTYLDETKSEVKKEYGAEIDLYIASLEHDELQEKTGQGETESKEQFWNKNDIEYMTNSEAITTFTDSKMKLPALTKLLNSPNNTIRFMRKGQRCRVHIGDFREYAQKHYVSDALANEIADEVLANREALKEKMRRNKKRTGK